jgi:hypothetical protein
MRIRHDKLEVLKRCGLGDLPVDAGGDKRLAAVLRRIRHYRKVEDEVTDLAVELILVDVPFLAVGVGNVHVGVKKRYPGKIGGPYDNRSIIWISDELGVIVSILSSAAVSQIHLHHLRQLAYWMIGELIKYLPG